MAVQKWCQRCSSRHPRGTRCPMLPPNRGSVSTARAAQRRFRNALVAESDGQCAFTDTTTGERCTVTVGLQAAHASRYVDDGRFDQGSLLCSVHHARLDRSR
jgi:hypothetical protein